MFCRAFSSLESIQNALQNILGINHEGSLSNVETNLEKTKKKHSECCLNLLTVSSFGCPKHYSCLNHVFWQNIGFFVELHVNFLTVYPCIHYSICILSYRNVHIYIYTPSSWTDRISSRKAGQGLCK